MSGDTNSDDAQNDSPSADLDNETILRHPLYPYLASLAEECEKGAFSLKADFNCGALQQQLLQAQRTDSGHSLTTGNDEIDSMMWLAVQVLRIHLLELEKVDDLCMHFVDRYIGCLKSKLSPEVLIGAYDEDEEDSDRLPCNNNASSDANMAHDENAGSVTANERAVSSDENNLKATSPSFTGSKPLGVQMKEEDKSDDVRGSQTMEDGSLNGACMDGSDECTSNASTELTDNDSRGLLTDLENGAKRTSLPKHATGVLRSWLFQHISHPYPTENEKRELAQETKLQLVQVNNWFINARRRILQPCSSTTTPTSLSSAPDTSRNSLSTPATSVVILLSPPQSTNVCSKMRAHRKNAINQSYLPNRPSLTSKPYQVNKTAHQDSKTDDIVNAVMASAANALVHNAGTSQHYGEHNIVIPSSIPSKPDNDIKANLVTVSKPVDIMDTSQINVQTSDTDQSPEVQLGNDSNDNGNRCEDNRKLSG